jgi:hypothetical protein
VASIPGNSGLKRRDVQGLPAAAEAVELRHRRHRGDIEETAGRLTTIIIALAGVIANDAYLYGFPMVESYTPLLLPIPLAAPSLWLNVQLPPKRAPLLLRLANELSGAFGRARAFGGKPE